MAIRKYQEENYTYQESSENQLPLYQEYIPEAETAPRLSELLFFLNIAAFCILTAIFSFVFLSFKMNTFAAFALAITASLASIQSYRMFLKFKKAN
ncbi:DUF3270 family protein [Streptococcus oricebi]|uniref:DUF3270 domain-containing protein n=1 Tax=Streptococcus oricebi TaxID=1547447 RepID=A0ABS5B398_9STRE|nr:DUF3270 family protein [Streptococcus oricebi]MBP2622938.1 DUF3270 domain-containing protein [Streptococcus oricebi]